MSISQKKIEDLLQYYLQNGFNHSTDEIVEGLNISRKTFFNRYISKENSVKMVLDAWYNNIRERFQGKAAQCNHAVEKLVLFGYEIHYIRHTEHIFFQHIEALGLLDSKDLPFVQILADILRDGINHYQFNERTDEVLYAKYIMNTISKYKYTTAERKEITRFLLSPILTERTISLLKELDYDDYI